MKLTLIAGFLILIAFVIAIHQFVVYGIWWEWSDLSHETWIIMFAFAGIVLLLFSRGK